MFHSLRNRLLLLNLIIITILMLVSFSIIYLYTYNNVHQTIDREIHRIAEFNKTSIDPNGKTRPKPAIPGRPQEEPVKRSMSFSIIVDSDWTMIHSFSTFDIDEELLNESIAIVKKAMDTSGTFTLSNNTWSYLLEKHADIFQITFMDITAEQTLLTNLIYTFIAVAAVSLLFIYLISNFLTNRSIQPIAEAFEKQKQFIADASHELKTPLTVIHTNIDTVLANPQDSVKSQEKWLQYVKLEVERMGKLTNDLLYLTHIDHTDVKTLFASFNFSQMVENAALTMEATMFEKNLHFEYAIDPDLFLYGNREQLMQVVMILLDNASKYTPEREQVRLCVTTQNQHIVLSVSNTGVGIEKDQLPKIFDRFYRIDPSRSKQTTGYGLGLAISKAIIEQHGGKISVQSEPDTYTTFTIRF